MLMFLAWGAILAYILYASTLTRKHRDTLQVKEVVVAITNNQESSQLVAADFIEQRLQQGGFSLVGESVKEINALGIVEYLSRNRFVERVDVYATLSGVVHIDITTHEPSVRLRVAGYDSYMTGDGYIFRSPQGSAYYTKVVTGNFRPLTPPNYEGDIDEYLHSQLQELQSQREKGQLSRGRDWPGSRELRLIEKREKKLHKGYDDLCKLANFVERIENDPFWGAEIVQFVADTTSCGAVSLRLIPRSGDFVIAFGELNEVDDKLKKLERFYNDGLRHLGWDRFKTIDIRYDKQVICRE